MPALARDAVSKGKEVSSLAAAQDYLAQMRSQICSNLRNGAKLPPARPNAPTTTIPAVCADLAEKPSPTTTDRCRRADDQGASHHRTADHEVSPPC